MKCRIPHTLLMSGLFALLLCSSACVVQPRVAQDDTGRDLYAEISAIRLYIGDSPQPIRPTRYGLRPGSNSRLVALMSMNQWSKFGDGGDRGPIDMGSSHFVPHKGQDPFVEDPSTFELEYKCVISSDSTDYPVKLKVTDIVRRIQTDETIMKIDQVLTIQGEAEFHALRSDDGNWMLLIRWQEMERED